MFFNSISKKIFLTVLLCIAPFINMQAGWFEYFKHVIKMATPYNLLNDIRCDLPFFNRKVVDNELIKKKFPHGYQYVQQELKNAGIQPTKIHLYTCPTPNESASSFRKLFLPFKIFEHGTHKHDSRTNSIELNVAQCALMHEIGHLKHHSKINGSIIVPTVASLGWISALFYSQNKFVGAGLSLFSLCLPHIYAHIDEHWADSYEIKQFKNNPEKLIDDAIVYLSEQPKVLTQFTQNANWFSFNPTVLNALHWYFDTHGSRLARANRLLNAVGIKTNQWELARELHRQTTKFTSYRQDICNFQFDMTPILASLTERLHEKWLRGSLFRRSLFA